MKIVALNDVKARNDSANPIFRGRVDVQDIIGEGTKEFRVIQVHFSPGARNIFHTHTFDQILFVTDGQGIIANEKEEVTVSKGTVILIPAGEKHWHGATRDSSFSHLAIMPPGETKY